jgi:hypothetical protein
MFKKINKKLLILAGIIVVGVLFPTRQAHAFVGAAITVISSILGVLGKAALGVAKEFGIIAGKFGIALAISTIFVIFANGFLDWAAAPDLVKGTLMENDLVSSGWGITRDFVNLFFILVLIAIGIGTALRIKGYEIKKALPKLILVAILINFTPVIVGVVVDASDIIINFFYKVNTGGFGKILSLSGNATSQLGQTLGEAIRHPTNIFNGKLLFKAVALMVFNFIAGFVMIIMGLLFVVRHIAIWVLVILSPLAFFSYILPQTQKLWGIWWQQLFKWAFIGVGAAFFLYLAQVMSYEISTPDKIITAPTAEGMALDSGTTFIIVQLLPIIFLLIAMFIINSTSAMGAKQIISFGRKSVKYPWTKEGKKKRQELKSWSQSKTRDIPIIGPKAQKAISRLESYTPQWGQDQNKGTTAGRWTKRQLAKAVGTGTTIVTKPGKMIFGEGLAASGQETSKTYREATRQDMWTNISKMKNATSAQKAGYVQGMIKQKQLGEAIKQNRLSNSDIIEVFKQAKLTNNKDLSDELKLATIHDDSMIKTLAQIETGSEEGLTEEDRDKGYGSYREKIFAKMKEDDMKEIQFDKLTNEQKEEFGKAASKFYDARKLGQAGKTIGREAMDEIQRFAQNKGPAWFFEIDENTGRARNSQLPRFFMSNGAADLGLAALEGASTKEEIKGLQGQSSHWEDHIRKATNVDDLTEVEKDIETNIKSSKNADLKQIHESALRAVRRKQQIFSAENVPRETETEKGKIILSEQAAKEEARRRREVRGTEDPGAYNPEQETEKQEGTEDPGAYNA